MAMKNKSLVFIGIIFLLTGSLTAKEPLKDYSFIRGVCHNLTPDQETLERDLGFMQRLQLNSTRVWLNQRAYESNPEEYINRVLNYVRTCNKYGVTVMPVLFSSGGFPALLEKNARAGCEKYVTAIVNALKKEEGLLMWDVCNEPNCNDYYRKAPPAEQQKRNDEIASVCKVLSEEEVVEEVVENIEIEVDNGLTDNESTEVNSENAEQTEE